MLFIEDFLHTEESASQSVTCLATFLENSGRHCEAIEVEAEDNLALGLFVSHAYF